MTSQKTGARKEKRASQPPRRSSLPEIVRSDRFRFAAAFGLSCLALHALVSVLPDSFARVVCEQTAGVLGRVLIFLGFPVVVGSNIVSGSGLTFQIVLECTALSSIALFLCFVSMSRTGARKKLIGLLAGIPALYLGNPLYGPVSTRLVLLRHRPVSFAHANMACFRLPLISHEGGRSFGCAAAPSTTRVSRSQNLEEKSGRFGRTL